MINEKHIDAYKVIDKAFSAGMEDDTEILRLIIEKCKYNDVGAVIALEEYYEQRKQIKAYLKSHNLSEEKPLQMGE